MLDMPLTKADSALVRRADTFEERLEQAEARAHQAEVENADLRDTVESLRKQVALLRTTLSRDRVLQHLQAKAVSEGALGKV